MRDGNAAASWKRTLVTMGFLLFAIAFFSSVGEGAEIHVGSGRAHRNIQEALNQAKPGDVVLVDDGTYAESVVTKRGGLKNRPIVIKAGGKVLLRGGFHIRHPYIKVEGFEIVGGGVNVIFQLDEGADNCQILNNNIHDFARARAIVMPRSTGTSSRPSECVIRGNWIHGDENADLYILMGGANHIVEKNEFGPGVIREDAIRPFGENITIRDNVFHDIRSGGGHTDVFQVFHNKGWRVRDLVFERNTIVNWEGQAWMADCTPESGNLIIRNNIYANIRGAGISYCPQTKVYNNLFFNTGYGRVGRAVFIRSKPRRGSGEKSEVINNIFYQTGGKKGGWYTVARGARSGFQGDYNLVFPRRAGFNEPHGINGKDPFFVNASGRDFRLRPQSPAIDAGKAIQGFHDDIEGNIRSGRWDIGPYELYSGAPKAVSRTRIASIPSP